MLLVIQTFCTVYFGSGNTLRDDKFLKRDGKVKRTH